MFYSLAGEWKVTLEDGTRASMMLPGTLDTNQIGHKDIAFGSWHPDVTLGNADEEFDKDAPIGTRFTRKHTYEGQAVITKEVTLEVESSKRIFVDVDRARSLGLLIDGQKIADYAVPSISTPRVFEITGFENGVHEFTFLADNSYPGWPHDAIVFSSSATDETQTNWNGLIGKIGIRTEENQFISSIRIYPTLKDADVYVEVDAPEGYQGTIKLCSEAFAEEEEKEISVPSGKTEVLFERIPLKTDVRLWDEYEGNLYSLSVSGTELEEKTVTFGVRVFGDNGKGRLALNGRTIFIRSEANCAEFPETGHPPMTAEEWTDILKMYKSYGINCMRFHSNCPPEAAFIAADHLGMMMEPELSHWNPKNAFEQDESYAYYTAELEQILRHLANHPSFVMLTFGNELWTGELGISRMNAMLDLAHRLDATRLFANASNGFYGTAGCDPKSDFYTSSSYYKEDLRGTFAGMPEKKEGDSTVDLNYRIPTKIKGYINNQYPNAKTTYDRAMAKLRETYEKPVFSFEVGQFEVLPYFEEIEDFHGISDPANLRLIRERAEKIGQLDVWNKYVEATGELSRIGYREEIEAAMRTKELSGISLLGLQDFPGQGTALVGMLDSHLKPKPFEFARPEKFHAFFRDQLPLIYLEKYTYENTETLEAEVILANFGKQRLEETLCYKMVGDGIEFEGDLGEVNAPAGELTAAGKIRISLGRIEKATRLDLTAMIGNVTNTYPIWVYPAETVACPGSIYEAEVLDEHAIEILKMGGKVFLTPKAEAAHMPASIGTQFTTDFWSVGTFGAQEGGMGQLIDETHPIFRTFPTEFHTNWQWWLMAGQRALILPYSIKSIITEMDSYAYMRPMTQLFECECEGGKLMVSSMGLKELQDYPEARALLNSIYRYMDSDEFCPCQNIGKEIIASIIV